MVKLRRKNKFVLILTFIAVIFSGCGNNKTENNKPIVISTITIIDDIVKQIAKDKVESKSICAIGTDPHTYKSVPEDSRLISKADIVFINGFGLEGWINKLIEASAKDIPVITVTKGITPLYDSKGHGDPDPHCWFDLRLIKYYTKNILEGLIEIDSKNEEFYKTNAEEFLIKIDSLHNETLIKISSIPENHRVLVTSHDAFRYFGEAYGIRVEALQGISTDAKAQTADVAKLVDLIKEKNLPAVFIETSVNPKLLEQIASETNAGIGGTLYSDSIGSEDSEGNSFINAFNFNVNTIVKALKNE